MLDIFKTILDVAKSLLRISDQLRNAEKDRRKDMAQLFEQISDCLVTVSMEIRTGGIPHGLSISIENCPVISVENCPPVLVG